MSKQSKKEKNKNYSIPDSAMVLPSSSDATQKTRERGMTDLADPKDGINDSTQNSF